MTALSFWRRYPREIASDLRRFFPGCHIRQWHSGELSSFELLELFGVTVIDDPEQRVRTLRVDFPPKDGAVDCALREGGFNRDQTIAAAIHNELALNRLWIHVGNGGKHYDPPRIDDPREDKARREEEQKRAELRERVQHNIFKGFDW